MLRIGAQILERKNRDGRLVGQSQPRRGNGGGRIRTIGSNSRSDIAVAAPREAFRSSSRRPPDPRKSGGPQQSETVRSLSSIACAGHAASSRLLSTPACLRAPRAAQPLAARARSARYRGRGFSGIGVEPERAKREGRRHSRQRIPFAIFSQQFRSAFTTCRRGQGILLECLWEEASSRWRII